MADLDLDRALRSLADEGEANATIPDPAAIRRVGDRRRTTKRAAAAGSVAAVAVLGIVLGSSFNSKTTELTPAGQPTSSSSITGANGSHAITSGQPVVAPGQQAPRVKGATAVWSTWTDPDPAQQTASYPAGRPNVSCAVAALSGRSDARTCTTTSGETLTMCFVSGSVDGGHAPVLCVTDLDKGQYRRYADAVWPAKVTSPTVVPMGVTLSDGARAILTRRVTEGGRITATYAAAAAEGRTASDAALTGVWDISAKAWTWTAADGKQVSPEWVIY